eukprot:9479355-Ditylum_brightwellii.AAC.1
MSSATNNKEQEEDTTTTKAEFKTNCNTEDDSSSGRFSQAGNIFHNQNEADEDNNKLSIVTDVTANKLSRTPKTPKTPKTINLWMY